MKESEVGLNNKTVETIGFAEFKCFFFFLGANLIFLSCQTVVLYGSPIYLVQYKSELLIAMLKTINFRIEIF